MARHFAIIVAIVAVALDQLAKSWVETNLPLQQPVELLPVLALYRTYNTGIAFSLLAGIPDRWLIAFTLAIVALVAWMWRQMAAHRVWARLGLALIMGGAIGNLIDRIVLGHVVDFILFHVQDWSFAVFNLADTFISVGAALVVLDEIVEMRRKGRSGAAG